MERLSTNQQQVLQQLQALLGPHEHDVEVLISVLQSLDWNVQTATELLLDGPPVEVRSSQRSIRQTQQPMIPLEYPVQERGHGAPRSLTQTFLALLSLPVSVLSGILRFVLGILRVPFLFNNNHTYRALRQTFPDTRGATRRWITALEEETGAVSIKSTGALTTGLDNPPSTSRRHAYPPTSPSDGSKVLPDFFDGTYEEVLDICQREGRIACVILVSDEHDDVPEFKRSTLTDATLVRMLSEKNFVVWGGDVRDKVSWEAAQKLQATTYPFVAFLALQPRRNPSTSSSNSSPILTVLSRHHGPSVPDSGPTSAQTLVHHLEHQLLPRVNPFLTRYKSQLQERERDRHLREQQDKAFEDSARRDRERVEARIREEQEEAGRLRMEEEARRQEEKRTQAERERQESAQAMRLQWRRWMRRSIVPPEPRGGNAIRLAIKLPGSGRVVRAFPSVSTLTALYAFADAQTIPLTMQLEGDPERVPEGPEGGLETLENYIQSQTQGPESWWGFKLALAYPRREIKWIANTTLVEAGLKNGEQLVMEATNSSYSSTSHPSDDDYESESD
ncbi:hypothetical protein HYDPIDRAFT_116756 [Hydnomerulius pinastri MD-312]|uniref:UBX domain-containing protein n=1 Tax=Hydnomerulius pinastri MD-312 TaxID=994086 RepID=A0A0C9WAV7_9AGAM|nr:hypothetical protein HYDPIDRAFT_116756 [Hydnomerulius pinastri MD-312]